MVEAHNKIYDVVGIGSPIVDMFQCNGNEIDLGRTSNFPIKRFLNTKETKDALNHVNNCIDCFPSGSVVNSIMGLSKLEVKTALIGKVGSDQFGNSFCNTIANFGIQTSGLQISNDSCSSTALCFVTLTPDGDKKMSTYLGSSLDLELNNTAKNIIKNSKIVYIEGYLWNSKKGRDICHQVSEICNKNNVKQAFNLSDIFIVSIFNSSILYYIKNNVNFIFGNEEEYKMLFKTGSLLNKLKDLANEIELVCMTRDIKGSIIFSAEESVEVDAYPVTCKNATGAGDLYVSGFIAAKLRKYPLRKTAEFASKVASHMVSFQPSDKMHAINQINALWS